MRFVINEGTAFIICDEFGDINPGAEEGLYYRDTRYVSSYHLMINGLRPEFLGAKKIDYYSSRHFLTNSADIFTKDSISIFRNRFIGDGLHEDIDIESFINQDMLIELSFKIESDFADIFEVKKDDFKKKGHFDYSIVKKENTIIHRYHRGDFSRVTRIRPVSDIPFELKKNRIIFNCSIPAKGKFHLCLNFDLGTDEELGQPKYTCNSFGLGIQEKSSEVQKWKDNAPTVRSDYFNLEKAFSQSIDDISALRINGAGLSEGDAIPAAGIPWFVTIFGRDSLITAYQTLLIGSELCKGILEVLVKFQGSKVDEFREEEPGKILHEIRFGELAVMQEIPHTPYYGTIDATPLFLILLGEYFRWTGDLKLIKRMIEPAEKALKWIDDYGDSDRDGYLEYKRKTGKGLANQGWKDSGNALLFASGELAEPPIALCEVQGYVYKAKKLMAMVYKGLGQTDKSIQLEQEAKSLKERFNQDFYMEEEQFYALALDGQKNQVDSITSNAGQLLWTGIVDSDKANLIKDKLIQDNLYSGWGIRTMSNLNQGYNPISYHNGSVWPHDNSLIIDGLRQYGFSQEAGQISQALLEAAAYFPDFRLPELFCGFTRQDYDFPVEYPTSSSPQAWASGSIALMVTSMLGLEPNIPEKKVYLYSNLPEMISSIYIKNLRLGSNIIEIEASRIGEETDISVDVIQGDVEVIAKPDGKV